MPAASTLAYTVPSAQVKALQAGISAGNAESAVQAIAETAWRAGAERAGLLNPIADELDKQIGSWTAYAKALVKSSITGLDVLAARHTGHSAFMAGSMDGLKAHGITHFNFVSDFKARNQPPIADQPPSKVGERADAATGPCEFCSSAENDSPHKVGGHVSYPPLHNSCECDIEPHGTTFRALADKPIDGASVGDSAGTPTGAAAEWPSEKSVAPIESVGRMSQAQTMTLNGYMSPDGNEIFNGGLRAGNPDDWAVEQLDAAIKTGELQNDSTLYRGMAMPADFNPAVGDSFTDAAYTSTTTDPSVAAEFAEFRATGTSANLGTTNVADGLHPVLMKINAPAGTSAIHGDRSVSEIVISRDSAFKVTDLSTDVAGRTLLTVELL